MKVKYFPDTDTAYIEFTQNEVLETRDINEDILVDMDKEGNLVGMTIEHAKIRANIAEFSYQQIARENVPNNARQQPGKARR